MITVYIGGGLANKMFEYAFSLAIKKKGLKVVYDTHTFKTEFQHDQVLLTDIFNNITMEEGSDSYMAAGKNSKTYRLLKRLLPQYVIETDNKYNDKVFEQLQNNCYVESSWQDERYFIDVQDEVRKAFIFPTLDDERNKRIASEIQQSNSVAIHIRKGDGYGSWNIFNNTCPKSYYVQALIYMRKHVDNPRFFVFTDSPEVVKEYLDINDYILINWNPTAGKKNYLDMQLMSQAKHNIIANSTYSWWGAWLNENPNKIVIAPRYWFNPKCKYSNENHIIPKSWIKL